MRAIRRFPRAAFTALQLVVVLAILLFLLGLMVPAVQKVREAAARTQSVNNLKEMSLAMHSFQDANKVLPPAVGEFNNQSGPAHFHILPYLEQAHLYRHGDGASWKNGVYGHVVPLYIDPRDLTTESHVYKNWLATTNYAVNWMVLKEGKAKIQTIPDGSSNTLMFAQRYQMCKGEPTAWGYPSIYTWAPIFAYYSTGKFQSAPKQEDCDPRLTQSLGRDMLAALFDASVRTVSADIRPTTWYYLCDPADGNVLPGDDF